jgi:hypothetical protein
VNAALDRNAGLDGLVPAVRYYLLHDSQLRILDQIDPLRRQWL